MLCVYLILVLILCGRIRPQVRLSNTTLSVAQCAFANSHLLSTIASSLREFVATPSLRTRTVEERLHGRDFRSDTNFPKIGKAYQIVVAVSRPKTQDTLIAAEGTVSLQQVPSPASHGRHGYRQRSNSSLSCIVRYSHGLCWTSHLYPLQDQPSSRVGRCGDCYCRRFFHCAMSHLSLP